MTPPDRIRERCESDWTEHVRRTVAEADLSVGSPAVREWLTVDGTLTHRIYLHAYVQALLPAHKVLEFDPDRVAHDDEAAEMTERLVDALSAYSARVQRIRALRRAPGPRPI